MCIDIFAKICKKSHEMLELLTEPFSMSTYSCLCCSENISSIRNKERKVRSEFGKFLIHFLPIVRSIPISSKATNHYYPSLIDLGLVFSLAFLCFGLTLAFSLKHLASTIILFWQFASFSFIFSYFSTPRMPNRKYSYTVNRFNMFNMTFTKHLNPWIFVTVCDMDWGFLGPGSRPPGGKGHGKFLLIGGGLKGAYHESNMVSTYQHSFFSKFTFLAFILFAKCSALLIPISSSKHNIAFKFYQINSQ